MSTAPAFLIICAAVVAAAIAFTRPAAPPRSRRTSRGPAALCRQPELQDYREVALRLGKVLDALAVYEVIMLARDQEIPAPLLNAWAWRHGPEITIDVVRAGFSVEQLRRHAGSLAGVDLESVTLQAELRAWARGGAGR